MNEISSVHCDFRYQPERICRQLLHPSWDACRPCSCCPAAVATRRSAATGWLCRCPTHRRPIFWAASEYWVADSSRSGTGRAECRRRNTAWPRKGSIGLRPNGPSRPRRTWRTWRRRPDVVTVRGMWLRWPIRHRTTKFRYHRPTCETNKSHT